MAKVTQLPPRFSEEEISGAVYPKAVLSAKLFKKNGDIVDHGVIALKYVTDAFVEALVDSLQGLTAYNFFDDFKFHGSGTDNTAENATDTVLGVEIDEGGRSMGTQAEGASANIYKSVGTISYSGAYDIVEHGLFNNALPGDSLTLMDRSVFGAISVTSGDSIQFTYQITFPSGS